MKTAAPNEQLSARDGSQANTAKLLEASPTLMRLRELGVLEKIAPAGKLNIVLGEKGLTDRVVNLLQSVKLQSVAKAQEAGNNLGLLGFLFWRRRVRRAPAGIKSRLLAA